MNPIAMTVAGMILSTAHSNTTEPATRAVLSSAVLALTGVTTVRNLRALAHNTAVVARDLDRVSEVAKIERAFSRPSTSEQAS